LIGFKLKINSSGHDKLTIEAIVDDAEINSTAKNKLIKT
jgi:hypothetical protein